MIFFILTDMCVYQIQRRQRNGGFRRIHWAQSSAEDQPLSSEKSPASTLHTTTASVVVFVCPCQVSLTKYDTVTPKSRTDVRQPEIAVHERSNEATALSSCLVRIETISWKDQFSPEFYPISEKATLSSVTIACRIAE